MQSHMGRVLCYGRGAVISTSRKQKLNTQSSTNAKLVAVDDMLVLIMWTRLFMKEHGYDEESSIIKQDNKSIILLEENGKKSLSQRTRAINIQYFYITAFYSTVAQVLF